MGRLRLRTFIAVPLEERVRKRVAALQEEFAAAGEGVKWVEPENLHVTLLFLGEIDARDVLDICKAVRGAADELAPFAMEVARVNGFPNLRRPRTLWVGVEEGKDDLIRLHHTLEEALMELGTYRREDREFTPHITLGRVGHELPPGLRSLLTDSADWSGGRQTVHEIHVMSSELTPDGPRYTVVSREKLRGESD